MNKKSYRIALTLLAIILTLSALAAGSSTKVEEIQFGEDTDVSLGRSGLVFTGSQYDGTVSLTRVNDDHLPGLYVPDFTQKLLNTRLYNAENQKVNFVIGTVYVYFKIRGEERKLWNKGELTIYYYNGGKNEWTECYTTYIFKPGDSRVSCRAKYMGLFGVGTK